MNALVDLISPKWRRYVYAVATLVGIVVGAWQAADGNWGVALGSLLGSLVTALARDNTNPEPEPTPPARVSARKSSTPVD